MSEIIKGEILINNIQLNVTDNLTEILRKTISIDKRIRNINNFQHLYFDTIQFYGELGRCRFVFNSSGILEEFSFGIGEEDYEYSEIDERKLILFLEKNKCEKKNHFLWGDVFLYKDIHFGNVSIVIKKTNKL